MSFRFAVQDTLYSPDEEPLYRSKYYVLGLSIHMGDDTQRLRSAGTMQKY